MSDENKDEPKLHWWLVTVSGFSKKNPAVGSITVSSSNKLFCEAAIKMVVDEKTKEGLTGVIIINVSYLGEGTKKEFNEMENKPTL